MIVNLNTSSQNGCLAVFLVLLSAVLSTELSAWVVMLLVGAAHHEISPEVPALGFTACVVLVALLGVLGALVRGNSK